MSLNPLLPWWSAAAHAHQQGSCLALLFDFDGTLTPIVNTPSRAALPIETREVLFKLSHQPRVKLGVLSGRPLQQVKDLIALPNLYYSGCSGNEIDLGEGNHHHPKAPYFQQDVEYVLNHLMPTIRNYPGAWVEHKPVGAALHYRQIAKNLIHDFRIDISHRVDQINHALNVHDVSLALELLPRDSWNKGVAARSMVQRLGNRVHVMYAGDAANDHEAMKYVLEKQGTIVRIGYDAPSIAGFHLDTPADLLSGLIALLEELRQSHITDVNPSQMVCKSERKRNDYVPVTN